MTHDSVVAAIQERAARRGILTHYCKRSVTCDGNRGMPDLVLVGASGAGWIEVKTRSCPTLDPGQTTWRHALIAAGQVYEVMHEADLQPGGAVDMFLDFVSLGAVA